MDIKLNEGSSVEIVNHSGNSIIKVNEDGTIEGLPEGVPFIPFSRFLVGGAYEGITISQLYEKLMNEGDASRRFLSTMDETNNTFCYVMICKFQDTETKYQIKGYALYEDSLMLLEHYDLDGTQPVKGFLDSDMYSATNICGTKLYEHVVSFNADSSKYPDEKICYFRFVSYSSSPVNSISHLSLADGIISAIQFLRQRKQVTPLRSIRRLERALRS